MVNLGRYETQVSVSRSPKAAWPEETHRIHTQGEMGRWGPAVAFSSVTCRVKISMH